MIIILNFGGQYTHLIARRIRELGCYAEILPFDISSSKIKELKPNGLILSGSPFSVYDENAPLPKSEIFSLNIPILGICYGQQIIAKILGGEVEKGKLREFGREILTVLDKKNLFKGLNKKEAVWFSHGDLVTKLPKGFKVIGKSRTSKIASFANSDNKIFGIQFHPEVIHTNKGLKIIENFIYGICNEKKSWKISNIKNIFSKDYYNITKEVSFRPVVSVFHFVNYFIWGNRAYGFRILELLIYSLICVCMYILCLKLFQNQTIAFISAVVFSLHPVHCEALGCISLGYGELLFSLFFLLAFIFYLNALEEFNANNIVFSYLFWIFALLSKETADILPVIILAHLVIYKYLNRRADSGIVQLRDSVGKKLLCFLSGYVLLILQNLFVTFLNLVGIINCFG